MDCDSFVTQLDDVFDGDLRDGRPRDPRFAALAAEWPASALRPSWLCSTWPRGCCPRARRTWRWAPSRAGRSAPSGWTPLTAMLVAVENFQEFGMLAQSARDELADNLRRHTPGARLAAARG